jgi:uncharacterized delta-60 repeat protein
VQRSALSLAASFLSLALCFEAQSAHAAAGSLDPSFGHGGQTAIAFSTSNGVTPYAAKLQSDGKIVVYAQFGTGTSAFVMRLTTSGALDKTFGKAGIARLAVPFDGLSASMALQSNGQIVVAGTTGEFQGQPEFTLTRLNPNGSVDTSFGNGGQVQANLGFPGTEETVLIQSDGRILLGAQLEPVGRRQPFRMALARFNTDGTPDTTFGNGGSVVVNGIGGASALALLTDGDILAISGSAIAQFTSTGVPEPTVTGGLITVASSSEVPSTANVFQSNGDYLLAQIFVIGTPRNRNDAAQVLRFTSTGTLDASFANPVFRFTAASGSGEIDSPTGIAVQSDGKIVVVGTHTTENQSGSSNLNAVVRLNSDGSFDRSFGVNGIVTNGVPNHSTALFGVLIQPADGKIITIGTAKTSSGVPELTVTRYLGQ